MYTVFFEEDDPYTYLCPTLFARGLGLGPTKFTAYQYLEYARQDAQDDTDRGLINALGNVKRAFHIVVDSTLNTYGLLANARRSNFPEKLDLLDNADLLPSAILRQLNLERNLMEHEYEIPSRQRVLEAIDVVRLLLLATRSLTSSVPYEFLVGVKESIAVRHALVRLLTTEGVLSFHDIRFDPERLRERHGTQFILGHIRKSGGFQKDVKVEKDAFRTVPLTARNTQDWLLLVKTLVQAEMSDHETPTGKEGGYATMYVQIAISEFAARGMSAMLKELDSTRRDWTYSDLPGINDTRQSD